ncbi:hypothetical protein [Microbacterium lacticum]|nr:hypothetical protein [Microbacterium lacticum]
MHEDEDDYTKFSPNNMMKVTDFQPMSAAEQAELDALLIASV